MKIAAAIAFVCFMGISVYVLLNEKNMSHSHAKVVASKPTSPSKNIGEKRRSDLPPYELQRQRIEDTTVYKFESKNKEENYELDEDQLDNFARSLNSLSAAKKAGQVELAEPMDVNGLKNNEGEKEYYQFDKE